MKPAVNPDDDVEKTRLRPPGDIANKMVSKADEMTDFVGIDEKRPDVLEDWLKATVAGAP